MFHNESMWPYSQKDKSKRHKTKQSRSLNKDSISKCSKHIKSTKLRNHHKHSKLRHIPTVSDYVGPERLTKHVGFFTKGKISESISRIEKIMPKEIKARAKQDLRAVLKLTCSVKSKQKKKLNANRTSISSQEQSMQSSFNTPQYIYNKTGFASSSWKNKLQKSVGLTAVNSILDSVHEPVQTTSIKELELIARKVILTKIHPFIKEANSLLFPNVSNQENLKRELQYVRDQLVPCATVNSENTSCYSSVHVSPQISPNNKINNSQNIIKEDFHLNPIFTGDTIDQNDITKMFPSVNEFVRCTDSLMRDTDSTNLTDKTHDSEIFFSQAPSSSIGRSTVNFVPTSPATSEDSPAWKLQISPVKFMAKLSSTPTLYFRHKMF